MNGLGQRVDAHDRLLNRIVGGLILLGAVGVGSLTLLLLRLAGLLG